MFPRQSARWAPASVSRFFQPALPIRRSFTSTRTALNSSQSSAYKDGLSAYRTFLGPFAKVFLGAVFTYQVIYWTWLKLEMDESKLEKNEEVAVLEKQAREITPKK
ncbi:hypothetical protein NUU61_007062 [Penicillium alfredii]|uniref:Uncharacterized protein n=1 Tax=Penicillium alfredii TaxID=1506179 RepID=A0A9W9K4V0_9EURO|nr:uncharacterized protein NUU61_007062 [Penicillium alfredii]KAJ5092192.1 hypothetical protein NUU61_007062 [Penicillium alfredii]